MILHNVSLEVQLIGDLLDLTRIARGKLEIARRPLDAQAVLRRAIETGCIEEMKMKAIDLHLDFKATATQVLADEARLSQIFWNIAKNAVKFTSDGGAVTFRTANPDGETFEVRIIDNGVGISPDKIGLIFDAFEQGGAQVTRRFGGLGLGLAISRALVELHEGRITAHSRGEGQGAEFVIRLPLAQKTESAWRENAAPILADSERGSGLRILLVEDHLEHRAHLAATPCSRRLHG